MVGMATFEASAPHDDTLGNTPEIHSAVTYWVETLLKQDKDISSWKLQTFREELFRGLRKRIEGHWYPENPERGQGYRALLCTERVDGLLMEALFKAGIGSIDFRASDQHIVMYIDPGNVSLRISPSHVYSRRAETTHTLFPPSPSPASPPPSVSPPRYSPPPQQYPQHYGVRVNA